MEIDPVEMRMIDTFKFRAGQEILLRDDEIGRLKEKLALFRSARTRKPPSHSKPNHEDELKQRHVKQESDLRLLEAKARSEHANLVQRLQQAHEIELRKLQSRLKQEYRNSAENPPVDDVDAFIESLRPKEAQPKVITDGALDLELNGIERECRVAESRIRDLKALLEKIKLQPTESMASGSSSDLVSSSVIENLKEVHYREMARLNNLILDQENRSRKVQRKLKRDTEASLNIYQEQIDRADRENQTWTLLSEGNEDQKEFHLNGLRNENWRLKAEISRIDFLLYGRRGKYQKWRPLRR
jgi:hypothetical protein